ncbi:hypothetical protein [Brevundimonas lutea]|uniref:hypothetical protein n=1 Tax=Brevundimonas lutea TaxID=2293980 RepID=UPI001F0C69F7|nr:hypothetical protein [Brevundimonas lutea]
MARPQTGGRQSGLLETVTRGTLGKSGLIAGLALLAACSSTPEADPPQAAAAPTSAPEAVEIAEVTQPVGTRMPSAQQDVCKAGELQWLVGRSRTEIPVPVEVVNRRVVCTECPITEDFSPYRLNIFYDADTGLVEQVRCG